MSQHGAEHHYADQYLVPVILEILNRISRGRGLRLVDVGCGDGYGAACYSAAGHTVQGFDASEEEIQRARQSHPDLRLEVASVYDEDIVERWKGPVDGVVALEVVEHLFDPKAFFAQSYRLLEEGGHLILSTPYHGYWKNLALAVLGGWDRHHGVDWDGGHIKFFSKGTLAEMAQKAGFKNLRFRGVGRFPYFWKSMILTAQK
ncbi:MAG: class I SAM-dependent methyltransferase [Elusimicrobiota bacterium]|jgi:2-polyprenyl-6-hydroxyphenyl methylase/3-demethylubiquinone-9 3-methyltransferase